MRVGTVVQETGRSLRDILRALDQRITAEDNLAPDGEAGQVLTSNGPNEPPTWQDIPAVAPSTGVGGSGTAGSLAIWLDQTTLGDGPISYLSGSISAIASVDISMTASADFNVSAANIGIDTSGSVIGVVGGDFDLGVDGYVAIYGDGGNVGIDMFSGDLSLFASEGIDLSAQEEISMTSYGGFTGLDLDNGAIFLTSTVNPGGALGPVTVQGSVVRPWTTDSVALGETGSRWSNFYTVNGDLSGDLLVADDSTVLGSTYTGAASSQFLSDPLASIGPDTPIVASVYGRTLMEYRTDSALEYDGPATHFVRRSASGGAAAINHILGMVGFSGGYGSGTQTLLNAVIYAQATETFTSYGTHGAADLVFGTKDASTTTAHAQPKMRLLAAGHLVPHTDGVSDLGVGSPELSARRWRSLRLSADFRTDAGTGAGGIVHWYMRTTGGTLRWGIGNIVADAGSTGADLAIWRYNSGGSLAGTWLTVNRSTGASAIVGDMTVTGFVSASTELRSPSLDTVGATDLTINRNNVLQLTIGSLSATFAGDVTVSGDNLNVNGLTYTWPASQAANRVLRNTGPGTLAWSQVDLSTDVTGTLSGATVPATHVSAGAFGASVGGGAYSFPSTLAVTGAITAGAGVLVNSTLGANGINWQDAGVNRVIMRLDSSTTWSMNIRDGAGASIDNAIGLTLAAGGTLVIRRPLTVDPGAAAALLTIGGSTATAATVNINGPAGVERRIDFRTSSSLRSVLRLSSTAESGSDAGSNIEWLFRTDAGAAIDTWLNVTRAAGGTIVFNAARPITGGTYNGQTLTSAANFTGTVAIASTLNVTGNLNALAVGNTFGTNAGASQTFVLNSASTGNRVISFQSAGTARWNVFVAGTTQLLNFQALDAVGAIIDSPLTIVNAAAGAITFASGRPVTMGSSLTITGALAGVTTIALSDQLTSTLATGTAPFVVASTTKVANLNADLLDDQTGSYYLDLANATGTLDETLGGTGQTTYTLGDILYASAANTLSKLAGNTTTTAMYLRQTGTGAASAAPVWDALTAADVAAGTFPGISYTMAELVIDTSGTLGFQTGGSIRFFGSWSIIALSAASTLSILGSSGGQSNALRLSGNNAAGAGAYIDLYGTSHANAGRLDIASGGSAALNLTSASGQIECADDIDLASGQVLRVNGTQVVAAQGAAVADATGAGDVVAQLNALLARIRAHGLIAT